MQKTSTYLDKRNTSRIRSVWITIILVISILKTVKMTGSTDRLMAKRVCREKEEGSSKIQKVKLPLKNPSSEDIKLYLKNSHENVFVKNLGLLEEGTKTLSSDLIDSLIIHRDNIYACNFAVSIPNQNPDSNPSRESSLLGKINSTLSAMKKDSIYNILVNYRKTEDAYKKPYIYMDQWIFNVFAQVEKKFNCEYTIITQLVYYLYKKEVSQANGNFDLAKDKFIQKLDGVGLSITDLKKIGISNELIKAIENEVTQEVRNEVDEIITKMTDNLYTIMSNAFVCFMEELPTIIQEYPVIYNKYKNVFDTAANQMKSSSSSTSGTSKENFSALKGMYLVHNQGYTKEKYNNQMEKYNEEWKNPIFVSSILYKNKMYLVIEFRLLPDNYSEIRAKYRFSIVEFTEENIHAIQEAQTTADLLNIPQEEKVEFFMHMVSKNLSRGIDILVKLFKSIRSNYFDSVDLSKNRKDQ